MAEDLKVGGSFSDGFQIKGSTVVASFPQTNLLFLSSSAHLFLVFSGVKFFSVSYEIKILVLKSGVKSEILKKKVLTRKAINGLPILSSGTALDLSFYENIAQFPLWDPETPLLQ